MGHKTMMRFWDYENTYQVRPLNVAGSESQDDADSDKKKRRKSNYIPGVSRVLEDLRTPEEIAFGKPASARK